MGSKLRTLAMTQGLLAREEKGETPSFPTSGTSAYFWNTEYSRMTFTTQYFATQYFTPCLTLCDLPKTNYCSRIIYQVISFQNNY